MCLAVIEDDLSPWTTVDCHPTTTVSATGSVRVVAHTPRLGSILAVVRSPATVSLTSTTAAFPASLTAGTAVTFDVLPRSSEGLSIACTQLEVARFSAILIPDKDAGRPSELPPALVEAPAATTQPGPVFCEGPAFRTTLRTTVTGSYAIVISYNNASIGSCPHAVDVVPAAVHAPYSTAAWPSIATAGVESTFLLHVCSDLTEDFVTPTMYAY